MPPSKRTYHCYYASKFNNMEKWYKLDVEAGSVREAKDLCWKAVMDKTCRHAFRIQVAVTDKIPKYVGEVQEGFPPVRKWIPYNQ